MNDVVEYRHVGSMVEWCCQRCGSVMQSRHIPNFGEEQCASCKATMSLAGTTLALVDLTKERDDWQRRAIEAERSVGELLDEIHELRGKR